MKIIHTTTELKKDLAPSWASGTSIALVPTMGNLHEGHLSLVRLANARAEKTVVSLFVNPTQFAPHEDYATYPRSIDRDCDKLAALGVDVVFVPTASDMYPLGQAGIRVHVPALEHLLCGVSRPHFFSGVAVVVLQLFNLVRPQIAVFGQKDFQQSVIVRQLIKALHYSIDIISAPTVRESDGLAMSSRNQYLSVEERARASLLYRVLQAVAHAWTENDLKANRVTLNEAKERLALGAFKVDYLEVCCAQDLTCGFSDVKNQKKVVLGAAYLGKTRLIDNVLLA